jgi:hypothetical protein
MTMSIRDAPVPPTSLGENVPEDVKMSKEEAGYVPGEMSKDVPELTDNELV